MGDKVLSLVAGILKKFVRSDDVLGRIGGDEFVILESGLQKEEFRARAKELQQALSANTTPKAAMGTAWRAREHFVEEAIKEADHNMYRDKNSTRGHDRVTLRRQL